MMLPLGAGGTINETEISSTVLAARRMASAYAGPMGRRLRSLGGSWKAPGFVLFDKKILSGPNESKNVIMLDLKPVSSDATVTTVVMPMTIPRMVKPERNRCVQTADIAIVIFSFGEIFIYSALRATMGSSFAAFDAGYHPLTTPTAPETKTDRQT